MPRIYVNTAPLQHLPGGLMAWFPGEFDFPDDPAYAGWLQGQIERGNISLVEPGVEVTLRTEGGTFGVPGDEESLTPRRCQATKANGEQCKADAIPGSNYCMSKAHQKQGEKP